MFHFGVDYYPEQWPEERWGEDARLMAEAGFNVVRLAEFAWAKLEPSEGDFNFDWLDRALSVMSERGIQAILGTPSGSPPAWLMTRYPEVFRMRADGRYLTFGNRREYCPNNPLYREYVRRIVTCMAERYAGHPSVIGWQIDNEFGDRCYCPVCTSAFQDWLCKRYISLDELNQKWGTVFWSHTYSDWSQIPVPLTTSNAPNPGLALDFSRFASDSYVDFQQAQIDILRHLCPKHFITHNLMGFQYDQLDYFDLARPLDFVAWDNYPRNQWSFHADVDSSGLALAADTMRGLKRQNFWVMEQQAGAGGWESLAVSPRPGELRLWAYQAIAHGADGVLFFRWRTARYGTEQNWHGLLDYNANPGRRYQEIKKMGAELHKVGDRIATSKVKPSIAMLLSYPSRFAFQVQAINPQFNYSAHFHQFYKALHRHGVAIDVVEPETDLTAYKLVIAPALTVMPERVADNLRKYVKLGGVLVATPRTGIKDEANAVVDLPLPGLLSDVFGIVVEEYDSLPPGVEQVLEFSLSELSVTNPPSASILCEILMPRGSEVIARYTRDYYASKPAITLNHFGNGQAVYVGTVGASPLYDTLAGWLLGVAGVRRLVAAPSGVEVAERWQGDRSLLFVLNHTEHVQEITLNGLYTNLLNGKDTIEGTIVVSPRNVLVLEKA